MKTVRILRQRGLTMVELMVAMVLMLLVTLATVALFNVTSSSYRTVDAGQELQDNARFAMEIIGQSARLAGYQDRTGPTTAGDFTDNVFGPSTIEPASWRVQGANNAQLSGTSSISFGSSNGVNKSDALIFRFFGANLPDPLNPSVPQYSGGFPVPDGSVIDCSGRPIPYPTGSLGVGVSAFYIKIYNGEPELYCKSWNPNSVSPSFSDTQIIRGIESLQVMYGVDTIGNPTGGGPDGIPDRWVSADSSWDASVSSPNWNNVVAVRVGMVLRGPPGSGQGQSATASENDIYPLGKSFTGSSTEDGLKLTPANDGRLRRAFATTLMIRNSAR
jgi:type IV pilus assembly protein PilW